MEVRVLGPLEVHHEGVAQLVTGAKARQLLSLLAIRPNEPVSPEVLIDELWEGSPPPTAASALRVHISHVREALEPVRANGHSQRLPLERSGYILRLGVDELDASQFELLVLHGREASMQGDVVGADEALTRALDHWRGAPLVEVRSLSAAQAAIARFEQLRQSALEELGEVRLALGKHGDVVDLLLQAVRDFPLAERLTAQLMLALYRCGRQAEALRAYSSLARCLAELGTQPSAEVRQLEEDILLQRDRIAFFDAADPKPTRTPSLTTPTFVGRRAERDRILALYQMAAGGTRRIALVSGTAGIGKTMLAAECAKGVADLGASVLTGLCGADPDAPSPIAHILASALPLVDPETRAITSAGLDRLGASPSSEDQPAPVGPDYPSEQLRLLDGVVRTIAALPACPVLVVEDVQWADDSTLILLRQLLRHPDIDRLLVIVTYRADQVDERRRKTIARLAPRDSTDAFALSGLNDHEVRSLVRAAMGPQVVPALLGVAVTLREATNGHPFHLRALLDELEVPAMASIERAELERLIENLAPLGVRALVDERVSRLTDQAQSVVRAAATIARAFSPELVAEVCGLSIDDLFDSVDEAISASLVVEDPRDDARFEFAHALVRNAIYFGMPEETRHDIHLRVAETMEAHNALAPHAHSQSELAKHYNAALPHGDLAKAGYYAARAGRDAAAHLAFAESVQWYEWAIEAANKLGNTAAELAQLELGLSGAYQGLRRQDPAREAFQRAAAHARAADDPRLLADIALAANASWISGFEGKDWGLRLLEEALAKLDANDPARRAQLAGRLATRLFYDDPDESDRFAREAVTISTALGDDTVAAQALLSERLARARTPEACDARLELTGRALNLVRGERSSVRMRVLRELLTDVLECGDFVRFETELERYERDARELASARDVYWAMALRATQATLHGDLSTAEQLVRGAAVRGFDLDLTVAGTEYLQRFVIHFQQGRLPEVGGVPDIDGDARPAYRAGAALAAVSLAESGRLDEALRTARWAVGSDGQAIARDGFWLAAHSLFALVAAAAGDRELAALLDEMISPCASQMVTFGAGAAVLGSGHHWLGLLAHTQGMPDRAVEYLNAAEAVSIRARAPYWIAQARFDLATVLETRDRAGDRERADELRIEAVRAAEQGGFDRILARSSSPHSR